MNDDNKTNIESNKIEKGNKKSLNPIISVVLIFAVIIGVFIIVFVINPTSDEKNKNESSLASVDFSTMDIMELLDYREDEDGYAILGFNRFDLTDDENKINTPEEMTIPDTIEGKPVVRIKEKAFERCIDLKKVVISDNVFEIGTSAFVECKSLVEVHLPKNLTVLETSVFSSCAMLEKINIPEGVVEIKIGAFSRVENLKELELPQSLKYLRNGAFFPGSLESITIPENVEIIEKNVFMSNPNLKTVTFQGDVSEIDKDAFSGCPNLLIITNGNGNVKKYAEDNNIPFE